MSVVHAVVVVALGAPPGGVVPQMGPPSLPIGGASMVAAVGAAGVALLLLAWGVWAGFSFVRRLFWRSKGGV
jgi:hypothetical protein